MFDLMRKLSGRKSGGLRKALEAKRRELARYGMEEMSALLGQWIDPELFKSESTGLFSRRRSFDFGTTFQAFLWQVMQGQASCREALHQVQNSRFAAGAKVPVTNTGAYCQARSHLPMNRLEKINSALEEKMQRLTREEDRWLGGREVKILDGTSLTMEDTAANAAEYSYASGQKPGCGFPMMDLVGVFNLSNGAWVGSCSSGSSKHDLGLSVDLLKTHIQAGDVALADRGFFAYWVMALIKTQGADALIRLKKGQLSDLRRGKALGKEDRLMVWNKPKRPPTCPLSEEDYAKLPDKIEVRVMRTRSEIKGYRTREMLLVTTLCDAKAIPAQRLADLYARRWQIELNFDDLKTTLGMDHLQCKSPKMVERAMAIYRCAYNLIRTLMLESAVHAHVPLQRLSFKGSADALLKALSGGCGGHSARKTKERWRLLIDLVAQDLLPVRPGRREPRALKRRPKRFQRLTAHRSTFRECPHRSGYRAKKPLN